MKQATFKTYLLAIPKLFILLAIVGVELIMAFFDLQIRRCRYRLELGVWPQLMDDKTFARIMRNAEKFLCGKH